MLSKCCRRGCQRYSIKETCAKPIIVNSCLFPVLQLRWPRVAQVDAPKDTRWSSVGSAHSFWCWDHVVCRWVRYKYALFFDVYGQNNQRLIVLLPILVAFIGWTHRWRCQHAYFTNLYILWVSQVPALQQSILLGDGLFIRWRIRFLLSTMQKIKSTRHESVGNTFWPSHWGHGECPTILFLWWHAAVGKGSQTGPDIQWTWLH